MSKKIKESTNLKVYSSDEEDSKSSKGKNSRNSRSSTPSSDRSNDRHEKTPFKRPGSRQRTSSSDSSSDEKIKIRTSSRTNSSQHSKIRKSDESDTASDSTVRNASNTNSKSFDRPPSSRASGRKKILRSSSSSSSSRSRSRSNSNASVDRRKNSDSDDDSTTLASSILKIRIETKPPIDKQTLSRKTSSRSSNFEKPVDNSDSESETRTNSHTSKHSKNKLNETFDADSQDSSNDMTDVSSLPVSPREPKTKFKIDKSDDEEMNPRGRAAFYSALNHKPLSRPNSVNFNLNQNYTNQADLSDRIYGRELMRIDSQHRKWLDYFLKENQGRTKLIERPFRLTSAAINRQKEQQRIEKENQMILKRLLSVKSTKEVRKDYQLKDYEKNMGVSDLNISKTSLKSNLSTKRSEKSTACNSRVSSAKSTRSHISNFSGRTLSQSRRPEWNDRW